MSDRISALTLGRPHSEECPYNMATSLHGLIRAAECLVNQVGYGGPDRGLSCLMSLIEERAGILSEVLDATAFSDLWPELNKWLERDQCLGLGDTSTDDPAPE